MFNVPFQFFAASCSSLLGFPTWYCYLPKNTDGSPSITGINDVWLIIAAVLEILLRIAALAAVTFVIVGAVKFITSQGEPDAAAKARTTIISALVGLVISVIAATAVTYIAGQFN